MKPIIVAVACLLSLGVAASVASASHVPGAPVNDDYLESLRLNEDRSRLERKDTLRDVRDTASASVQGDVFSPGRGGGPAEVTTCGPSSFGKTVWYDFYPDVSGLVRLRASGFNTVLSVIPFNRTTGVPDFGSRQCADESAGLTEEFLVSVRGKRAYTVQVGGAGNASGSLEFLFDFLADTDADGVLDDVDKCDRSVGTRANAGCPVRVSADVSFRARPTPNGIRIVSFSVNATRGARVQVSCAGCGKQVRKARTVRFPRLRGRSLPAGSRVVVRATKRGAIGRHISYRVLRGNITKKVVRCMNPGSRTPRRTCG